MHWNCKSVGNSSCTKETIKYSEWYARNLICLCHKVPYISHECDLNKKKTILFRQNVHKRLMEAFLKGTLYANKDNLLNEIEFSRKCVYISLHFCLYVKNECFKK
jgi:hypothetical protein